MNQDKLILLNRIVELESDVHQLNEMNVELAWDLHDRDRIIEDLRNQLSTLREILRHEGYFDETVYH